LVAKSNTFKQSIAYPAIISLSKQRAWTAISINMWRMLFLLMVQYKSAPIPNKELPLKAKKKDYVMGWSEKEGMNGVVGTTTTARHWAVLIPHGFFY